MENKNAKNIRKNSEYTLNKLSVLGKKKIQNLIKDFNLITKKPISIIIFKGFWNGYSFPILDKFISAKDAQRLKKSKKLKTNKNYAELINLTKSNADAIIDNFEKIFTAKYPSAPNVMNEIIQRYKNKGRKISVEMLSRMDNLIIAHVRHNYTDYDITPYDSSLRLQFNSQARQIIKTWEQE